MKDNIYMSFLNKAFLKMLKKKKKELWVASEAGADLWDWALNLGVDTNSL